MIGYLENKKIEILKSCIGQDLRKVNYIYWLSDGFKSLDWIELIFERTNIYLTAGSQANNIDLFLGDLNLEVERIKKEYSNTVVIKVIEQKNDSWEKLIGSTLKDFKPIHYEGEVHNSIIFFMKNGMFEIYAGADDLHVEFEASKIGAIY